MNKYVRVGVAIAIFVLCVIGIIVIRSADDPTPKYYIVKQVNGVGDTSYLIQSRMLFGVTIDQGRFNNKELAEYVCSIYNHHSYYDSLRTLRESWKTIEER